MKNYLLLILLISVYTFNLRQTKQDYDSYVMAVQWSNGYCKANSCGSKADHVYTNKMTIHGLWPSLKSGKYLSDCTSGVTINNDGSTMFKNMEQYWPSFSTSNTNEYFWEHEYNKHGYCMVEEKGWSGYTQYFNYVLNLHKATYNDLITNAFSYSGTTVTLTYDQVKTAIQKVIPNATFKMNCKSNYIYEFYFYLELDTTTPSTSSRFSNTCTSAQLVFK